MVNRLRNLVPMLVGSCCLFAGVAWADDAPASADLFGFGTPASNEDIAGWDIAIGPDGAELPAGQGSVADGERVYQQYCAACHGLEGHEDPDPRLVGGRGSLGGENPVLTIGSYWAYPTTLYDYIARAMPFTAPGTLSPDQVYAVVAYLLHKNDVVPASQTLDRDTLPAIEMPNRHGFVPDPRPDAGRSENAGS